MKFAGESSFATLFCALAADKLFLCARPLSSLSGARALARVRKAVTKGPLTLLPAAKGEVAMSIRAHGAGWVTAPCTLLRIPGAGFGDEACCDHRSRD